MPELDIFARVAAIEIPPGKTMSAPEAGSYTWSQLLNQDLNEVERAIVEHQVAVCNALRFDEPDPTLPPAAI